MHIGTEGNRRAIHRRAIVTGKEPLPVRKYLFDIIALWRVFLYLLHQGVLKENTEILRQMFCIRERELTRDWHFQKYLGSEVTVRLIRPVDGVRDFTGVLTASDENGVTIQLDEENEMTFERSEAAYVRLVDNYDYASAELAEDSE